MHPTRPAPAWLRLLARTQRMRLVHLNAQPERAEAGRLLYEIFVVEQGWDPPTPNASELRADHDTRRLTDRFDDVAIWLGLRDERGRLIATMRILWRDAPGALEIEGYTTLAPHLLTRAIEANRVVVARAHRGALPLAILHTYACCIGRAVGATQAIGTTRAEIAHGVARRMGWVPRGHAFRYHPEDPAPAHLISYDLSVSYQLRVLAKLLALSIQHITTSRTS